MPRSAEQNRGSTSAAGDFGPIPGTEHHARAGRIPTARPNSAVRHDDGSKHRALLAAIPDLVLRVARDGVVLDEFGNAEASLLCSQGSTVGKQVDLVVPGEAGQHCRNAVDAAFRSGEPQTCECSWTTAGGLHFFEVRSSVSDEDEAIVIVRDVTGQKLSARKNGDRESQFDAFFRHAPAGLILLDHELRIVKLSDSFSESHGIDVVGAIGRKPTEIWPSRVAAAIEAEALNAFRTGAAGLSGEISGEMPNQPNVVRIFACSRFPIRDSDGEITLAGLILVETTPWKEAQQALAHSEERFRSHYRHNPVPIYTWQKVDGDFVCRDFNLAAEQLSHGKIHRLIGVRLTEFFQDMPDIIEHFRRCYETREPVSHEMTYRYRLTGKVGEVKDLVVRYVFIPPDQIMVHTEDVTEWKRAQQAVRQSEQQYRKLLDDQLDGVAVVCHGLIVYANQSMCQLCETDRQDLIGRSPLELMEPEDHARLSHKGGFLVGRGIGSVTEAVVITMKGNRIPIEISSRRIQFHGEPCLLLVVRDLTDKKRIEELYRRRQVELLHVDRLHTLGEMASGLGHELNQPLSAIATYASTCRKLNENGRSPEEIDQLDRFLNKIEDQSLRAGQIIHRLRKLCVRSEPTRSVCSINEAVRNAVALVDPEARFKRIAIQLDLDETLPDIEADPVGVEQVLINLMRNSLEAMAEHPVPPDRPESRHRLTVQSSRSTANELTVLVSDTGPGIRPDLKNDIFDVFLTTKPQGMGLGLAVSKSIVEADGGSISVCEAQGRGATFRVTLPIGSVY